MCSVKFYVSTMILAAAVADPGSYMIQMGGNRYMVQAAPRHDQQYEASDYSSGYDFGGQHQEQSYDGQNDYNLGSQGHVFGGQGQDYGGQTHDFGGQSQGYGGQTHDFGNQGHNLKSYSYPVHQHVEEENPEPIKHYREVIVPLPKNVEFKINQPIIIPVPHPVPIHVPVPKAVVIPIIKEVSIPVEKSVPYPVEKTVHVPKIKEVPFEVVKHIIVPVEKPVPFKVPVYETIIHTKKGSHKI